MQLSDSILLTINILNILSMPDITNNAHTACRLSEIERAIKAKNIRPENPFFSSTLGGKRLKVTNNNGSAFFMAMPRGDSPIIEGLAARKAEVDSFNKTLSRLATK